MRPKLFKLKPIMNKKILRLIKLRAKFRKDAQAWAVKHGGKDARVQFDDSWGGNTWVRGIIFPTGFNVNHKAWANDRHRGIGMKPRAGTELREEMERMKCGAESEAIAALLYEEGWQLDISFHLLKEQVYIEVKATEGPLDGIRISDLEFEKLFSRAKHSNYCVF